MSDKDTEAGSPATTPFSPIVQTLIPELLSEIFIASLPDNSMPKMRQDEAPLSVSQVCRTWRNTALSTRRLWSRVHIVCADDDYVLDIAQALRQWFDRSRSVDIALRIEFPRTVVNPEDWRGTSLASWPAIETVFREAMEHSGRLTSLSILLNNAYLEEVSSFIRKNFRCLKRFELHVSSQSRSWLDPIDISQYSDIFSRLSELKLCFKSTDTDGMTMRSFMLPLCQNLRKLYLDFCVTPGQFVTALQKCPSVEEVTLHHRSTFHFSTAAEPQFPVPPRKIFKSIRSCTIVSLGLKPAHVTTILRASQMPSLSHLIISLPSENMLEGPGNNGNESYLEDFLVRSSPPLESLHIEGLPVPPASISRCLKISPRLRRLHITMSAHIAQSLTLPSQMPERDTLLCPSLEEVEILLPPLDFQDAQALFSALADMVRSRWNLSRDRKPPLATVGSKPPKTQVPRVLRQLTMPSCNVKRHPLYKAIRDCIRQGFVLGSSGC